MKNKKLKNLGLSFEKTTISRLEQMSINGGEQAGQIEAASKPSEREETCFCTYRGC